MGAIEGAYGSEGVAVRSAGSAAAVRGADAAGGSSRRLSASWIADIAASVGSCILFGLFAMTVRVLNSLQGIAARPGPTVGSHARCARAANPLPFGGRIVAVKHEIPPLRHPNALRQRMKPALVTSL